MLRSAVLAIKVPWVLMIQRGTQIASRMLASAKRRPTPLEMRPCKSKVSELECHRSEEGVSP